MADLIPDVPRQFNAAVWLVDRHVDEGRGQKTAIVCQDESYSYAQLADRVDGCARALRDWGLFPEQRVLMIMADAPPFAFVFLGAMKMGAVPVPCSTLLKPENYLALLDDSRARVLVVDAEFYGRVEPILDRTHFLEKVIVARGEVPGRQRLEEMIAAAAGGFEAFPTTADDSAFWLYSFRNPAFPMGAIHLHHDMRLCTALYAENVLGMTGDDVTFSASKLFFAFGLGGGLYFALDAGGTAVLHPGPPRPEPVFAVIARHRPSVFFGAPTLYGYLLDHAAKPEHTAAVKAALGNLRVCISAGEALPADLYRRWKEAFGLDILDGVGTTDLGHIFITNRPGRVKPGSTGQLVEGYQARLVDEHGAEVPAGEAGELWIKGDTTAAAYWNRHQQTKDYMTGHWFNTGDRYRIDEDGFFWYIGRSDDMLKVGGIWVAPTEIEATLNDHPAVSESAVVGRADAEGLIKPYAFVVLAEGQAPSDDLAAQLKDHVKHRIAHYKYPRWIEFTEQIPKAGPFILRHVLRAKLADK
jgi:benzoate-CoA ligase family protein